MTKRSKQLALAVAALVTGVLVGISARPEALAQGIQGLRVAPSARLVKAAGGARTSPPGEAAFQPVQALTAEQRRGLLASLDLPTAPGQRYVRVSPSEANVPNKAGLLFVNAYMVETMNGYARWSTTSPLANTPYFGAVLWVHSEGAGRRYLVDCAARGGRFMELHVTGPGGLDQTVAGNMDGMHITWVIDATNGEWYGFNLTPRKTGNGQNAFELQNCDVTAL